MIAFAHGNNVKNNRKERGGSLEDTIVFKNPIAYTLGNVAENKRK